MSTNADLISNADAQSALKKLERLESDGSNWDVWRDKMLVIFELGGVLGIVDGSEEEPTSDSGKKKRKAKVTRVKGYFMQALNDAEYKLTINLDPHEAWTQLNSSFEFSAIDTTIGIIQTLKFLSTSKTSEIDSFVRQHEELLSKAISSGFTLAKSAPDSATSDEKEKCKTGNIVYCHFILWGLPPQDQDWKTFYALFKADTQHGWKPRILLDRIKAELKSRSVKSISKTSNPLLTSSPHSETALVNKTNSRPPRPQCAHCKMKKPNHPPEKCFQNPKNPGNKLGEKKEDRRKGSEKKEGEKKEGGNSGGGNEREKGNVTHVTFGGESCAVAAVSKGGGSKYFLDSCASAHVSNDRSTFSSLSPYSEEITCAEGGVMMAEGKGAITLETEVDGKKVEVTINGVTYVPSSKWNLISLPTLTRQGAKVVFHPDQTFEVLKNGSKVFTGSSKEFGIAHLSTGGTVACVAAVSETERRAKVTQIHRQLGHPGKGAMRDLLKAGYLPGCSTSDLDNFFKKICPPCLKGKSTSSPFSTSTSTTSEPLALIHSDIAGPITNGSFGGARYFIFIIDEATDFIEAEPMKEKSEVTEKFEKMLLRMKNSLSPLTLSTSTRLQSDNGSEYLSSEFKSMLNRHKILHQTSIPYTPQQNGKAERTVRTIKEKITTLLADAHLGTRFWAEALPHAVFIINRLPSSSLSGQTPYHRIHDKNDSKLEHLPIFGQQVWMHLKSPDVFEPKAVDCRFLATGDHYGKRGFRVQVLGARGGQGVHWTRDMYFSKEEATEMAKEGGEEDEEIMVDFKVDEVEESQSTEGGEIEEETEEEVRKKDMAENELAERWGAPEGSKRRKPQKVAVAQGIALLLKSSTPIVEESDDVGLLVRKPPLLDLKNRPLPTVPTSSEDALTSLYKDEWKDSMKKEIDGLKMQQAWELVERNEKDKILGSRWHYTIKHDKENNPTSLKSRLVVQGCKNIPWLAQFGPRSAPLASLEVILLFFVIVSHYKLYSVTTDVAQGYLAASTDLITEVPILMKQPPHFVDPSLPDHVCLLRKALYGLPQSGRAFYHRVKKFVGDLNLLAVSDDTSLYYGIRNGTLFLFLAYVDDGMVASSKELVEEFLSEFRDEFDVKIRGTLDGSEFLGREMGYDETGRITVSCVGAIRRALGVVNFEHLRPLHVPIQKGITYMKNEDSPIDQHEYLVAVGHLQWIASIRFDIAYATNVAARYSTNPGKEHWSLVKRIYSYLKSTMNVKRVIGGEREPSEGLVAYVDADFAGDIETRRSTTGSIVTFKGSTIAHTSKRQSLVTLSTFQAESVALTTTLTQLEWLASIINSLPIPTDSPILIRSDNASLVTNLNSPTYSERNKNVDIKIKYVQEQIKTGFIEVEWISSEDNLADLLTKPLPASRHRLLSEKAGLIGFGEREGWGSR